MRKVALSMLKEAPYKKIKDLVDHSLTNKLRLASEFSVAVRTINRWIDGYKKYGKEYFVHGNNKHMMFQ